RIRASTGGFCCIRVAGLLDFTVLEQRPIERGVGVLFYLRAVPLAPSGVAATTERRRRFAESRPVFSAAGAGARADPNLSTRGRFVPGLAVCPAGGPRGHHAGGGVGDDCAGRG